MVIYISTNNPRKYDTFFSELVLCTLEGHKLMQINIKNHHLEMYLSSCIIHEGSKLLTET